MTTINRRGDGRGMNEASRGNLRQFREQEPETSAHDVPATLTENQGLIPCTPDAGSILDAAAPSAAVFLAGVVAGKGRAPMAVRVTAATKILEGRGLQPPQQPFNNGDDDQQMKVLAALERALALRKRRQDSIDAVPTSEAGA